MAVKMIDSNFKSIVTGKKSILDLKHNDACKYKKWYNLYDIKSPVEDIRWIPEYRDIISDDINKSNSKESSKRMEFESLARILLAINKKKNKKYSKDLFLKGKEIQKNINHLKENQIMSDDEKYNYLDYKTLVKIRDRLPDKTYKDHLKKLVLALNTYIPPLRINLPNMIFWESEDMPPHDNNNYLWVDYEDDDIYYVINNDKVSKNHDREVLLFEDTNFMEGAKMTKMIFDSLSRFPRKYVLQCEFSKTPLNRRQYYSLLQSAAGHPINQNILRKAYINHYHNIVPKLSIFHKKLLAKYMRHSLPTAQLNYEYVNV